MQSDKCAAWWILTALFEVDLDPLVIAPRLHSARCQYWKSSSSSRRRQKSNLGAFPIVSLPYRLATLFFLSLLLIQSNKIAFSLSLHISVSLYLLPVQMASSAGTNEKVTTQWQSEGKKKTAKCNRRKCWVNEFEVLFNWNHDSSRDSCAVFLSIAGSLRPPHWDSRFAPLQANNHFVNNWVKRCSLQSIYYNEYFIHSATSGSQPHNFVSISALNWNNLLGSPSFKISSVAVANWLLESADRDGDEETKQEASKMQIMYTLTALNLAIMIALIWTLLDARSHFSTTSHRAYFVDSLAHTHTHGHSQQCEESYYSNIHSQYTYLSKLERRLK